jgi:signal transduction histidine kinase
MFNSLRSRLWLTYALLAGGVLCIVASGLVVFLLRNPSQARQAYQRVQVIALGIQTRDLLLENATPAQIKRGLQRIDQIYGVRVLRISVGKSVIDDTRASTNGDFPHIPLPTGSQLQSKYQVRDAQGRVWVYAVRSLQEGGWVIVAVQTTGPALFQLLRDDLVPPILEAGLVALVAGLILAFWVTRWVVAPLKHISSAAHDISAGKYQPIQVEGPSEIKELGQAFNDMAVRVQNAQNSQRDFVANVSHELKTPLTSIQGFATAILDGTANTPEALQQANQVIYTEASRMSRLVVDLLSLARLDAGIADMQHAPLDMAVLLKSVVDKMTPQARLAQVDLALQMGDLPWLNGDADRLSQIFTNLVDNAIKYTPSGGHIRIQADYTDGKVIVSITDSGVGIGPQDLPHIFERFYQIDKSRRGGSQHGVGLGLAIAREIVLAHHGNISVTSVPGQGSTFTVLLPISGSKDVTQASNKSGRSV